MLTVEEFETRATLRVAPQSLAVVRIVFGVVGTLSALRLLWNGWASSLYAAPRHHLAYPAMGWVPVPSEAGMQLLVGCIALCGVAVTLGWRHRLATTVFWCCFTWLEFSEVSVYLNHYWFVSLVGVLILVLPVDAAWSLDARRRRRRGEPAREVPQGAVWLLRAQVGVVYVFAGLAKLHPDWLLHGLPLALWLPARRDVPVLGWLSAQPGAAVLLSWAGAVFDCLVVVLLCVRRTRLAAWCVVVVFHVITWLLFPMIGVFPWLMIGLSTVFFEPDWPSRVAERVAPNAARARLGPPHPAAIRSSDPGRRLPRWVLGVAALWMLVQITLPLRHLLYEGDSRWSGEGYRFSWNVLATEKAGDVQFRLTDPATGRSWTDSGEAAFSAAQLRAIRTDPELIRQAAHALADDALAADPVDGDAAPERVEVRVDAYMSLNGRRAARLIDPDVDLAAEPFRLGHQPWVLPAPSA